MRVWTVSSFTNGKTLLLALSLKKGINSANGKTILLDNTKICWNRWECVPAIVLSFKNRAGHPGWFSQKSLALSEGLLFGVLNSGRVRIYRPGSNMYTMGMWTITG